MFFLSTVLATSLLRTLFPLPNPSEKKPVELRSGRSSKAGNSAIATQRYCAIFLKDNNMPKKYMYQKEKKQLEDEGNYIRNSFIIIALCEMLIG
jgi:hypothetical protein